MQDFKYQIGTDCWIIIPEYGHVLYRGNIAARIKEETGSGIKLMYRVTFHDRTITHDVDECFVFDVLTRSHDAICRLHEILSKAK